MPILAIYCYATEIIGRQHVRSVTWTIDPSSDGSFHRIYRAHIICNILTEGSLKEWNLLGPIMEVCMAYRDYTVSHSDIVWLCYIVKSLIPLQSGKSMLLPKFIGEV